MTTLTPMPMLVDSKTLGLYESTIRSALPRTLTGATTIKDALVAVDGSSEEWVDRVTEVAGAGARGVLVEAPTRVGFDEVIKVQGVASKIPVLLRRPYLSNPAIDEARAAWKHIDGGLSLVTDQFVSPSAKIHDSLFDHLSLVRAIAGEVKSIGVVTVRSFGYTITLTLWNGMTAVIGGVRSRTELTRVHVQALNPPRRFALDVFTDETSRPATIVSVDEDGECISPTSYENSHRAAWRRLTMAVAGKGALVDVSDYLADLELWARVTANPT
jgi:hypothetical protein